MLAGNERPLEEREFPDEADLAEDDEDEVVTLTRCGRCGGPIYEEAQKCPYCGEWIVQPGQQWRRSRKWYVRAGLYLAKAILINWIFWLILLGVGSVVALWKFWLGFRSR